MANGPFDNGPFDWVIRLVVTLLLIFTFSCILLRPLWKLAMSRPSLIIVFSRAIGNYLGLFVEMPRFIVSNIFKIPMTPDESYYWPFAYSFNGYLNIMTTSPHVHNLALAINRSHSLFFPFHYNMVFAKKKNIYMLCLCLWLICICVGASNNFVQISTKNTILPASLLNKYCMCASGVCYAALGCRMLWMRYKNPSMNGASTEKDSIKILVVCFTCLAMSSLNQLVFLPFVRLANENFSDTPRLAVYWGANITQWLILCTEEICLALLVRDFRRNLKQQLHTIFYCCCRGKNESSNGSGSNIYQNNNTVATRREPIRVVHVTRVKTLMNTRNN